jgi:hypothetical protein
VVMQNIALMQHLTALILNLFAIQKNVKTLPHQRSKCSAIQYGSYEVWVKTDFTRGIRLYRAVT